VVRDHEEMLTDFEKDFDYAEVKKWPPYLKA